MNCCSIEVVTSAAETLVQKAIAAGMPGVQVDGNDVIAVRHVVDQALQRARDGDGPTLIEALTYRLSDHTTVDDAGVWDEAREQDLLASVEQEIEAAVERYLTMSAEPPEAMFDHLFAALPSSLSSQRQAVHADAADGVGDG